MPLRTRYRRVFALSCVALLLAGLVPLLSSPAQGPLTPSATVAHAWKLARLSGRYDFRTSIEQYSQQQPSLRNAGRPARPSYLSMAGSIDQPAERLEFSFSQSRTFDPQHAVGVKIEDGTAMQRVGNGQWKPAELDTMSFAPAGDPLGFLAGMGNVTLDRVETHGFSAVQQTYTSYAFDVDGSAFGRFMQENLEAQLRAQGKLPAWMSADFSQVYGQLAGSGSLWVDADGLPVRLRLELTLPGDAQAGPTRATVTTDFSSFDRQRLALASTSLTNNPAGWIAYRLDRYQRQLRQLGWYLLGLLTVAGLIVLSVRSWQRRGFYAGTVSLVILSMLTSPLVMGAQATAFAAEQQADAIEQQAASDKQATREQVRANLTAPTMNPHESPAAAHPAEKRAGSVRPGPQSAIASATEDDGADSDGDGLSDYDEGEWDSCPSATSSDEDCNGVLDPTDSDGDGLLDGEEVNNIGTLPGEWDTDGDSITDTLEIAGFSYNNQTWYLNPSETDTNSDGMLDSAECVSLVGSSSSFDPAAGCPDSDGDGTPDVWDDDNDGDGVIDSLDTSPNNGASTSYDDANPLDLTITELEPNTPVFVDIQLRPTDDAQLGYVGSVLDWPSGDTEGQIVRHLSSTFESTANPDIQTQDANAANGDIRIIPMLEITMPYTTGHFANLPVKSSFTGTRTTSTTVDEWVDTDVLDPYAITVRDSADGSGDLITYVPLSDVTDPDSGLRTALTARMLYWPSQSSGGVATWGSAQEYRVVWMVQMITDSCLVDEVLATCTDSLQVIHTYQDEPWRLTGLSVREDHGLDVNILYEDPAQDSDLSADDDLWAATWDLDKIWLRGRDCATMVDGVCQSDGSRDVTVATMESAIDGWSENTDAIEAVQHSYDHEGYISSIMMTETTSLLDSTFTGVVDEATLLFAQEETYRSAGLSTATATGYSLSVSMDQDVAPPMVQATMSWARYQYSSAGGWTNYDWEDDLARLKLELAEQDAFSEAGSSSADDAEGKIIAMQSYYSALLSGVSSTVELSGALTWTTSDPDVEGLLESEYESSWPKTTFKGASYVIGEHTTVVQKMVVSWLANKGGFYETLAYLANGFVDPWHVSTSFKAKIGIGSTLMTASIIGIGIGFTLMFAGMISGNETVTDVGVYILNGMTVAVTAIYAIKLLTNFYRTYVALSGASAILTQIAKTAYSNAATAGSVIVALVATWGIFLYSIVASGNADPNSIGFNYLLSQAISASIVSLVLAAISFIPIVGPIIVLLIYLVDALIYLACQCDGLMTLVTGALAEAMFDVDTLVKNMDSSSRLTIDIADIDFASDDAGFTTDNWATFAVSVTSTILRGKDDTDSDARKTTFLYALQDAPDDFAYPELGEISDGWVALDGRYLSYETRVEQEQSTDISFAELGSGINRDMAGMLYLSEAYALPYRGCVNWGFNLTCSSWYYTNGHTHLNLGEYLAFDILPPTLSEFYALDWNNSTEIAFPAQLDHDNDGLTSSVDPNDLVLDTDGDDLSDYQEYIQGSDPEIADSDGDGLLDGKEIRLGTNPLSADTDHDTLSDSDEAAGWRYTYTVDGAERSIWVWSSPFSSDADEDGLTDVDEYTFEFNPLVATDTDEILDIIAIQNEGITEDAAPRLLMRFEEQSGATMFSDTSGSGMLASCAGATTCPTAGESGRYGSGASFDGNDTLTVADSSAITLSSFTLAGWFYHDPSVRNSGTMIQKEGSWALRRWTNSNTVVFSLPGLGALQASYDGSTSGWHHAAAVFNGSTRSIYIDGVLAASDTISGSIATNANAITLGDSLDGLVDDVAVYQYAMAQVQVQELIDGIYYQDDGVVRPGQTLSATTSVENKSMRFPLATTYSAQVDEDYTGTTTVAPVARFKLDEASGATSFANAQSSSRPGSCSGTACPTTGVSGYRDYGVQMASPSVVKLDSVLSATAAFTSAIAFGAWVYPMGGGTKQFQRVFTLQSADSTSLSTLLDSLYYDKTNQRFLSTYTSSSSANTARLNSWHHVMLVYDLVSGAQLLYDNGQLLAYGSNTSAPYSPLGKQLRLGSPFATEASNYGGFIGRVDDVTVYGQLLNSTDVQQIMQDSAPTRPDELDALVFSVPASSKQSLSGSFTVPSDSAPGLFSYTQSADGALDISDLASTTTAPALRVHFDEADWTRLYSGQSPYYAAISCATDCPAAVTDSALAGGAREFDGANDAIAVPLSADAWTIGVWFKPTHDSSATSSYAILGRRDASGGFPSISMTTAETLEFALSTSSGWKTYALDGGAVSLNVWQQLTLTYDGDMSFNIYLDGELYDAVTATPASLTSSLYLGAIGTGYTNFKGRMDNLTVYHAELTASEVETLSSERDLALHAHYTFDEPPGDSVITDLAGVIGDVTCTACPTLGIKGQVNRAALFDGDDSLSSSSMPGFWQAVPSSYTVAGWVKMEQGQILEMRSPAMPFAVWNDRVAGGYASSDYFSSKVYDPQSADEWVQVAVVYDKDGADDGLYINGVRTNATPWTATDSTGRAAAPLTIAQDLIGYMDDLRLYQRDLSSSEILSLYETSTPVLQLSFEEDYSATTFADSSPSGTDGTAVGAISGNAGRVGNGVLLDGSGAVAVSGATALDGQTSALTLMAWVKPSATSGEQTIIATSSQASGGGLRFSLFGNKLMLATSTESVLSTATVASDNWAHVAVVLRDSVKATFYINGIYAGSGTLSFSAAADTDGRVTAGARTINGGGTYQSAFTGKLDELSAYKRVLSAAEVKATYTEQLRWYSTQQSTELLIDGDAPFIKVLTTDTYLGGDSPQITLITTDTTSAILGFDYTIRGPDGVTHELGGAACADSESNHLWCPTFDPDDFGGDGAYTFQFRVIDAGGNQTTSPSSTFYIDSTPPTAAASYTPVEEDPFPYPWGSGGADADQSLTWTVPLTGTLSDPILNVTNGITLTGSGLNMDTVKVELLDAAGRVAGDGPFPATISGESWSADYQFSGMPPSGRYTLRMTAADSLGNSATADLGAVYYDLSGPTAELNSISLPDTVMNATTLQGVVTDLAIPSGPLVYFPFTEGSGSSFSGSRSDALVGTCASCPAAGYDMFGGSRLFSASGATSITVPATDELELTEGTLSAWIKPAWAAGSRGYDPAILALSDGASTRYSLRVSDDYSALLIDNGATTESVAVAGLAQGEWAHVAIVHDGNSWTAYVNGSAVGGASQSLGSAAGLPLVIGAASSGSGFFDGSIDEVLIYNRELTPAEIYHLAQDEVAGVQSVQLWFQPFSFDSPPDTSMDDPTANWQTVDIADQTQGEWSYTLPSTLEGFYQIKLRAVDENGTIKNVGVVWRGVIDTQAPRITYALTHVGGMLTGYTQYSVTFNENFMDTSTLVEPCGASSRTYTYSTNPVLPTQITVSCRTSRITTTSVTMKLCDTQGLCTTVTDRPATADYSEVAISSPADNSVVKGSGALTIKGAAYADATTIKSIVVSVDGSQIGSWSYPSSQAQQRVWSITWTPSNPGTYTIQATMTTWSNKTYTDSATVRVSTSLAPGGQGDNLSLWLDPATDLSGADDAPATTGMTVTGWLDQASGWQAWSTGEHSPTLALDAINFNPAVTFGISGSSALSFGSNYVTVPSGGMTMFAVTAPTEAGMTTFLDVGSYATTGYGMSYGVNGAQAYVPADNTLTGQGQSMLVSHSNGGLPALLSYAVTFGSGSTLSINGGQVAGTTNTALSQIGSSNIAHSSTAQASTGPLTVGRQASMSDPDNYFQGDVAEVLIYAGTLTLAQRRQVEAYLAIKYGLTLTDGGQPVSYTSSGGAVLWDASAQSGFHNNVTGIGRDDTSGLYQTRSLGSGSGALVTLANGASIDSPGSFSADSSFLLVGDNGGSLSSAITTTQGAVSYQRLARTWQARETGTVGTVQVAVDLDGLDSIPTKIWLAVSSAQSFSSAQLTQGTIYNGQAIFPVNLSDGQYFALAINATDAIAVATSGSGSVTSSPSGISCPGTCSAIFDYSEAVTLTATPDTGSSFAGWSGACSGTGTCTVTVGQLGSITASFSLNQYALTVTRTTGTGLGAVTSSPSGITCGADCSEMFTYGTVVTLTATPATGSTFNGWSGACSGVLTCVVTIGVVNSVTAQFSNPDGYPASETAWAIPGTVQAESYNNGGLGVGYYSSGYGPKARDSSDGNGTILGYVASGYWTKYTVDVAESGSYRLDVRYRANMSSTSYAALDIYVDNAKAAAFSLTGTSYTQQTASASGVYLTAGQHVLKLAFGSNTALGSGPEYNWVSFTRQHSLSLSTKGGAGSGIISSSTGDSCGKLSTCDVKVTAGSVVTLSATAATGSSFTGWSGACTNSSGDCTVTMSQTQYVTATFALNSYPLNLSLTGAATGSVKVSYDGTTTTCDDDCTVNIPYGSAVTLAATPGTGLFYGWENSGLCSTSANATRSTCSFTMTTAGKQATARFETAYVLTVSADGTGSGVIQGGFPSDLSCGNGDTDCEHTIWYGEQYTVGAYANTGSTFAGWSDSACQNANPINCTLTITESRHLTGTFTLNTYDVRVAVDGSGSGGVTSTPAGIDCGASATDCSEMFGHGTVLTLTATPATNAYFVGWAGDCGGAANPCALTVDGVKTITATIEYCVAAPIVTNANDSGPGSLRQAILDACPTKGVIGFDGDYTINLTSQIEITRGLTIDAGGQNVTVSGALTSAGGTGGIFKVSASDPVTLIGLTLADGRANQGGAIYTTGNLRLVDSTLSANSATADGGALYQAGGSLSVSGGSLSGNSAANDGGALYQASAGTLDITGASITSNTSGGAGGGLRLGGTATISATLLVSNTSADVGGAIDSHGATTISASQILSNTTGWQGGAVNEESSTLSIDETTLAYNQATDGDGGAIYAEGTLSLTESTLEHNSAAYDGGALYIWDAAATISASTFASNSGDNGGAIYARRSVDGIGVVNSTFASNAAGSSGGAIVAASGYPIFTTGGWVYGVPTFAVTNTTFAANSATDGGTLAMFSGSGGTGAVKLWNSIIADSTSASCSGPLSTNVSNLIEDTSCGTPAVSGDPQLGPLADNGGKTHTFALQYGSPAIDAGDNATCATTDQRGVARPIRSCDLGAYEYSGGYKLEVTTLGTGAVSSSPAGITCGTDCSAFFAYGSVVTLTATTSQVFQGWSDGCSGTGDCVLTIDGPKAVTATFTCSPSQVVTNGNDSGSGSLRNAIQAVCDNGAITFAGDYTVELTSQIEITRGLSIDGGTHAITLSGELSTDTSIDGGIFKITASDPVTLTALTFADGTARNGGAIYSTGTLTVSESSFIRNAASTTTTTHGYGGAIYSTGALTVNDSAFSSNTAKKAGGAIGQMAGGVSISGSSFTQNTASTYYGGGALHLAAGSTASVTTSSFSGNNAELGGAIRVLGTATISGSSFTQNTSSYGGAAVDIENDGSAIISTSVISGNQADIGGAIYLDGTLIISDTAVVDNIAGSQGGGLYLWNGPLTISGSTFSGNSVTQGDGGALYARRSSGVTITNSTFAGNSAVASSGWTGKGGALYIDRGYPYGSENNDVKAPVVSVTNTTFSGNTAEEGGAFSIRPELNGAIGTIHLWNTIIDNPGAVDACSGAISTNVHTLSQDASCTPTITADPLLGTLADNGGETETMALPQGSPALDAGDNATCASVDQRGRGRPYNATCDIGAFESQGLLALSLTLAGTGSGSVTNAAAGINCASSCTPMVYESTVVTLTAVPATGSAFAGWSGACAGTGVCTVTMTETRAVTATFTLNAYALTVTPIGTGGGAVSSSPVGIDCGTTCAATFAYGASVTLTAVPATGSAFAGWSGACAGTGVCTVTMTETRAVTATFTLNAYALTVMPSGTGGGAVSSSPAGIDCGTTCTATFAYGASVTLTAVPATGSAFAGWSGACAGAGVCTVTMTEARAVTATFTTIAATQHSLTVTVGGSGSGSVTSTPAGISCGTTCSASFDQGTVVTLTATAAANAVFNGWGGACAGAATTCTVTMDQVRNVTASFNRRYMIFMPIIRR
jgi:predicted outer membrane repeat protein